MSPNRVRVRAIEEGHPAWPAALALLEARAGASLAALGLADDAGAVVLAGFGDADLESGERAEDRPVAVGVFRDYRDPALHIGNAIDLDRLGDILEMETVGLYQIAMLLADEDRVPLRDAAAALVRGFESWLRERYERHVLFISLLAEGNALARPLYRELGFKPHGQPSRYMQFELPRLGKLTRRVKPLPEAIAVRFFDEVDDSLLRDAERGFASCYAQVFLDLDRGGEAPLDLAAAMARVLDAPDFARELSLLLVEVAGDRGGERDEARVVGFMLAELPEPARMHAAVAGLLPEWRGKRLPLRTLPMLVQRAEALGVDRVTFVTAQSRVVRLGLRAFGAKELDGIQTWTKVG